MTDQQGRIARENRVRLTRIRSFFDGTRGTPFYLMVAGVFFVFFLRHEGGSDVLLCLWLAALALFCAQIFLFERHVRKTGLSVENSGRLFFLRKLFGGLLAGFFGACVVFLPPETSTTAYTFVFIIATSIVAGGYLVYATAYAYGLLVNALVLWPFTLLCLYRYLMAQDDFFLLMLLTSLLWQISFAIKAFNVSRSVLGEIEVRERLSDEVAERQLAERALRVSQEQAQQLASMLRLMCDTVPDMIWAKDLKGRFTFVNLAFCEKVLGVGSTEETLGKNYDDFARRERERHPDDPEWHTFGQYVQDVDQHTLSRDEPTIFEESGTVRGTFVFLEIHQARFVDAQGEVIGIVGCARDITKRKASEDLVQHLAHHDGLTDLPNRLLLVDRLRQALAHARRDKGRLAVLFVDLDRLKPVNDTFGHDIGDLLLKDVAGRLRAVISRESDTVSRLGGDEFVILLQRVNKERDAAVVAEKILHVLAQSFLICGNEISISGSVGIAVYPQHGDEVSQLMKNADIAMYSAKHGGRNTYRFFDESMRRG